MLLPAAGLFAGLAVSRMLSGARARGLTALVIFAAACVHAVYGQREILFRMTPIQISRTIYGRNPFPEAVEVGEYIRAHTTEGDTIAVLGSEPEIYFYAGRRPATGYIYTYPLMEPQPYALEMQQEMIREIEAAAPAYIVFVKVPLSWLPRPSSERYIFEWFNQYRQEQFDLDGLVDIMFPEETVYSWNLKGRNVPPRSDCFLRVYRRRDHR
jgi:hypothetical protein